MSPYDRTILDDAPLAYWRLDELSGTSAADSSGNGHAGTYVNAPTLGMAGLVTCENGGAAKLASASTQYINGGNPAAFSIPGNLTVEAWISSDNVAANFQQIIAKDDTGGCNYELRFSGTTGKVEFLVQSGGSFFTATGATVLANNTIYHVAGTYDGAHVRVFVNGVQDGIAVASGALASSGQALGIGIRSISVGGQFPFSGKISKAAIYGSALSARLLSHYNAGITQGSFAAPIAPAPRRAVA